MLKSIRYPQYNMQSGELMELLGLKPGGHLPDEGMPGRYINGVYVYVLAAVRPCAECGNAVIGNETQCTHCDAPMLQKTRRKSSAHRVMAICPTCTRQMSAGRLHQHAKVHKRKV